MGVGCSLKGSTASAIVQLHDFDKSIIRDLNLHSLNSWGNICDGNGVSVHPYTHPQHGKTSNHLICVSDGRGMQFERFYNLNHSTVTWLRHVINVRFQPTNSTLGEMFVMVMVWVVCIHILYPRHGKVLKHQIYVYDGCGMQFERFYNLSHSAVTWFWPVHRHLGFQPTHLALGETFVVVMVWVCVHIHIHSIHSFSITLYVYMMDVGCSLKGSTASTRAQWHCFLDT